MRRSVVRLWVLTALRRPRRALSTVLVLAVLTVATTASLVAGDALARLFRDDAHAEWGAVDVEARSARGPFLGDGVGRLLRVEAGQAVRAGAPRLELRVIARAGERREPQSAVLGLGAEDQEFGPLVVRAGAGSTLGLPREQALVNARLADRLRLTVGAAIDLVIAVPEWRERIPGRETPRLHPALAVPLHLTVAGVVENRGVADLHRTANVLVRREVLQEVTGLSPAQSTALHLDVRGEGRSAAEDVIDDLTPVAQRLGVVLTPVKENSLDVADGEGGLFRSLLMSLALLVLLASAAATVELLTALGLDRSSELAVLRASGVRRRAAARLLLSEAVLYAGIGTVLGLLLAAPAGAALTGALADHFAGLEDSRGREQVALSTSVTATPLVIGASVVALTALLAARASARRVLAADLDDVLRGAGPGTLPRPVGLTMPVTLLAAGAWLLGAGATATSGGRVLTYLGLTLMLCAGWSRARRQATDRARTDTRWALAALAWSVPGAALLGDFSAGVQAGFGVLTVAGVLAIAASAYLLASRLRGAGRVLRSYLPRGRTQGTLLVGMAWAHEERDRSALRMSTVGAALFTAAALTVLGSAAALPVQRQAGGFDAIGTSVAALDAPALSRATSSSVVAVPHVVIPETAYRTQRDDGPGRSVPYPVRLAVATSAFTQEQRFGLAASLASYASSGAALSAVLGDEDKAVVDRYALPEGAEVGDDVVLEVRGQQRRFTLVAVLDTYLLQTVFIGGRPFDDLVARSGDTLAFVRGDVDRATLTDALNREGAAQGLDLQSVDVLRDDVVSVNRTFTDVFAVMLLLGLVVVVVSIGAATVRSTRQRRAQIGLLRALGYRRGGVLGALIAEPVMAAVLGAVVGVAVGLAVLRGLFALGYSSLAFVLDVGRLSAAVGGTLALVLLTSIAAAWPASRRDLARDLADLG